MGKLPIVTRFTNRLSILSTVQPRRWQVRDTNVYVTGVEMQSIYCATSSALNTSTPH
jgi:hypothetical protein